MTSQTPASPVRLAFLIEAAQDEWQEDGPWKSRERAAAEAVLEHFTLIEKPKPFRVGHVIATPEGAARLPHLAVVMNEHGLVIQVSDPGSVADTEDWCDYGPREYRSPFWCSRVYDIGHELPLTITWLPKPGQTHLEPSEVQS